MYFTIRLLAPLLLVTNIVLSAPVTNIRSTTTTTDTTLEDLVTASFADGKVASLLSNLPSLEDDNKIASLLSLENDKVASLLSLDETKLASLLNGPPVSNTDEDKDGDGDDDKEAKKIKIPWLSKGIDKIKNIFRPKPKMDKWAQPNTSFMSWSRR